MINRLLNSGKFWLKTVFFGALAAFLLFVGLYASVYHYFSAERLQAFANQSLAHTHRSIRFDKNIGRNWFPRPTVTLKNLVISRPDSSYGAIHIKETRIGLAWKSLWSAQPVIEKWVVSGADAAIERTAAGQWNLQDLYRPQTQKIRINRLIIEGSTLHLRLINGDYPIENFSLKLQSPDSEGREFTVGGTLKHPHLPLNWQGSGIVKTSAEGWQIPALRLTAEGRLKNENIKISADSALSWQAQTGALQANNLSARADSSYRQAHISAQIPLAVLKSDHLFVNAFNSAFTAGDVKNEWNGSFKFDKANLRPSVATIDSFELNANHKAATLQTSFAASGPLIWQQSSGLKSDTLHFSSLQDTINQAPRPRYISLLDGSFSMADFDHAEGKFSGYFDRQPTALTLKYSRDQGQTPLLEAGIALQKLALAPYWEDLEAQSGNIYPEFLNDDRLPDIQAQVKIGSIQLPGLQLDNVESLISADREHIALTNFKAGLYGGHTEGGLSMADTSPISYHLQQNAQGVQIRPLLQDLFGFHSFSGTGDAVIDLTTKGQDRRSLLQQLDGTLTLNVSDGAWHGIDMNNILQSGNIGKNTENHLQTPFQRFTLNSVIEKGISHHLNTELYSDTLRVISSGFTDLEKQELSEEVLIHNARNPDSRPVPIKIKGPAKNPSITLDYARLTNGLNTPEEKQQALQNTLREQWNWLIPKKKENVK